jgi:hypothetical protein
MLLLHGTSFLLPHACMSSSPLRFFYSPQFCDVFVAVATIHKRKEPNLVTGQIEEESKHFLQSCYDVFATFKKNQVSRLLPCFLLIRKEKLWRTKRHLKRNLATLEKRKRKLRCRVDAKFCKTNLASSLNNTLSLSMHHVSTVMIIEHQGLHGYSLRIQAINTKHHHLIHRGMQIVDRLIKTQS